MNISAQINHDAAVRLVPLNAFADLTYRCNLQCYYCYQRAYSRTEELEPRQWAAIFAELADAGCLYLTISGGEPFLRSDIEPILCAARRNDFALSIITNGTLVTERHIALLRDIGVVDVGVSLHAADGATHDRLCGVAGSFDTTLLTIERLRASRITTIIKHSVSAANFSRYRALEELATRYGCLFECDSMILAAGDNPEPDYSLSQAQQLQFLGDMYPDHVSAGPLPSDGWNLHCDAGRSVCGITSGGDVVPCILIPEVFGSCVKGSFLQAWHSQAAVRFRERETTMDPGCLSCTIASSCSRCYGISARERGDWHRPAPTVCRRAAALNQLLDRNNYSGIGLVRIANTLS